MRSFFTKNIGWKLLSLAAAVLLWIAVASEPEVSTFLSVRVEYTNLSTGVEINSDTAESIILEVRGPSGELRGLPETRRLYGVVLDMSDVGPGQHTFTIAGGNVRLPRGVQLVRSVPAQVRLDLERSAMRRVPVEVRFAAGLSPRLQVVEATPEPASLAITGPASRVFRVCVSRDRPHRSEAGGGRRRVSRQRLCERSPRALSSPGQRYSQSYD